MSGDTLSATEAARLLNVSEATMRRWIRQGLFHGVSGHRIERSEVLRWAREHGIAAGDRPSPRPEPEADLLADAVARGAVVVGRDPADAAEAIGLAIEALPLADERRRPELLQEVLERERMASTGLGLGVALPHPRKPPAGLVDEPVISVCFPERPLDWAALDGAPVFAVLLVLAPNAPVHLQLLARIAFVLRSETFVEFLRGRPGRDELVERLRSIRKDP